MHDGKEKRKDGDVDRNWRGDWRGSARPDLDPLTVACGFLAYQNGLALLWLSDKEAFSIKGIAPELVVLLLFRSIVQYRLSSCQQIDLC